MSLRILMLSTVDTGGGAPRASYRLLQALQKHTDAEISMRVLRKRGNDPTVQQPRGYLDRFISVIAPDIDVLPLRLYPARRRNSISTPFSLNWFPYPVARKVRQINPDIIHLHWIALGFLPNIALSQLGKPIIWTLHDMQPFTGGCHYNEACRAFEQRCGHCPQLGSHQEQDLSRWIWHQKQASWTKANMTIVAPSHWLADEAQRSSLMREMRVEWIPNTLDLTRYQPHEQAMARKVLGLPQHSKVILFGALNSTTDKRKGYEYVLGALRLLGEAWQARAELVVFGSNVQVSEWIEGFQVHFMGTLSDDVALTLVYAAADVFVAPSKQENLSNTVLEALACGSPAVAFKIGGMPDLIQHQENGYLAKPFESQSLADGIAWVLSQPEPAQLRQRARQQAEKLLAEVSIAAKYMALYQEIVSQTQHKT